MNYFILKSHCNEISCTLLEDSRLAKHFRYEISTYIDGVVRLPTDPDSGAQDKANEPDRR